MLASGFLADRILLHFGLVGAMYSDWMDPVVNDDIGNGSSANNVVLHVVFVRAINRCLFANDNDAVAGVGKFWRKIRIRLSSSARIVRSFVELNSQRPMTGQPGCTLGNLLRSTTLSFGIWSAG